MSAELQPRTWNQLVAKLSRLPHALLLFGPAGVGKLALAERFAQLLLCERPAQDVVPCGACDGCRWFSAGNHPDIRYVEPEAMARHLQPGEETEEERPRTAKPSNDIRVEQVRALADFVNIGSHRGARRVALIHPAEEMNAHAANALLKNLEEPPPAAVFVLVAHRPARLLPTIRSRCVSVAVPIPDAPAARAWLASQGVPEPDRWLAFCGGAPRRALALATGEQGGAIRRLLRAVAEGEPLLADSVNTREDLEALAEVLQKVALDRAFGALAGQVKYLPSSARSGPGEARPWLDYAREMGRNRALARHPLNPRLFASELVSAMPPTGGS